MTSDAERTARYLEGAAPGSMESDKYAAALIRRLEKERDEALSEKSRWEYLAMDAWQRADKASNELLQLRYGKKGQQERDEARNKALDDAIASIAKAWSDVYGLNDVVDIINALKSQ